MQVRKIKELPVFVVTTTFSIFARGARSQRGASIVFFCSLGGLVGFVGWVLRVGGVPEGTEANVTLDIPGVTEVFDWLKPR